jgi:Flp pilus assembly protein TadD
MSTVCGKRTAGMLGGMALALLAGCAGVQPSHPSPPADARMEVPDDVLGRYASALHLMQDQRYDRAGEILEAVTRSRPDLPGPYVNLGIAYLHLDRLADAERSLTRALELDPDNAALVHNLLGVVYRKSGRFAEARRCYERALELDPGYADAHLNLGILLELYLQQPEAALEHYARYRQLGGADDARVNSWITDLKRRLPAGGHTTADASS